MAVVSTSPDAPQAVTRRPDVSWTPLRVYSYDDRNRCTTSTVYGYRCSCSCGHQGKVRRTVHAVRADVRQHEAEHADGR